MGGVEQAICSLAIARIPSEFRHAGDDASRAVFIVRDQGTVAALSNFDSESPGLSSRGISFLARRRGRG